MGTSSEDGLRTFEPFDDNTSASDADFNKLPLPWKSVNTKKTEITKWDPQPLSVEKVQAP